MLEKEANRQGYDLYELTKAEWLKPIFKRYTLNSNDDMFEAVITFAAETPALGYAVFALRIQEEKALIAGLDLPGGLKLPNASLTAGAVMGHDTVIENEFLE